MDGDTETFATLVAPVTGEGAPEYQSEEHAATRINPAIDPENEDWKRMYEEFSQLLTTHKTLQQILSMHFTRHEARMFSPGDRHDVKAMQQRNTDRYYALLEGTLKTLPRDLATKFTMMYFGLPIEPLISPLDELLAEMEPREPEGQRYDIDPPLHFLTAHTVRNWGRDSMKGNILLLTS